MSSENNMSVDGAQSSQRELRTAVPNLDLNCPPPRDSMLPNEVGRDSQQENKNAIEILDDDIAIIDQDTFTKAIDNARRNQASIRYGIVDMDYDSDYLYYTLTEFVKFTYGQSIKKEPDAEGKNKMIAQNPPAAAARPEFNCPICMSSLTEPTATRCGHIFCKECIAAALLAQSKCPTCRKKLGKRGIFRVYLPAVN